MPAVAAEVAQAVARLAGKGYAAGYAAEAFVVAQAVPS